MKRLGAVTLIALASLLLASPRTASAQGFPFCAPGQTPTFIFGFASLKAQLGAVMGDPAECEHPNNANGDTLQKTTTGLAYWRKSTNTPTFTDGYRHWAITSAGLVSWVGASPDPPASASVPSPPPPAPAPSPGPQVPNLEGFARAVSGQIDQFWKEMFASIGTPYTSPRLQWVPRGDNPPRCGSEATRGPGYCSLNGTMVLSEVFFERLWQEDVDAAVVVVIAHEWGHHVQRSLGIFSGQFFTIQTELQADCLAGVFFQYANQQGWLDRGDLDEALAMSWSSGDSVLVAWFDENAHGTPRQRVDAFSRGFLGRESCAYYTS